MIDGGVWQLVQIGMVTGVLHSFDADHVAAVTGLSSQQRQSKYWSLFSLQWAAGHGVAVLLVAMAVFILGMAIPFRMSELAEQAVAYTLIAIGVAAWFQLYSEHRGQKNRSSRSAKAAMVGLLHGCAGSAPLLALLPISTMESPVWGLAYVLLFCLGVVFAMLLLGKLLAVSMSNIDRKVNISFLWLRPLFATVSLALGLYLLAVSF